MYDNLPQDNHRTGITRAVYQEMYSATFPNKKKNFQDCNNGKPLKNVHTQKRPNQFRHCNSSDNFYPSNQLTLKVSGDTYDTKKRRMSVDFKQQMNSDYADMESYNYCLPLNQSFELMTHIPSIFDDLKQELEVLNEEISSDSFTLSSQPPSPFPDNSVNASQVFQKNIQDNDIGSIKLEHLKLCNDLSNTESKSPTGTRNSKRIPNLISWDNTMSRPCPLFNYNSHMALLSSQTKTYPENSVSQEVQMLPSPQQENGVFFGNGFVLPADANQNIDEAIQMQQQIIPNAVPSQKRFEDLGREVTSEDNLFDGWYEKELLIDLFRELTDDLKQANAEHVISISGFEDINMDEFTDMLCRTPRTVRRQEAGNRRNEAISSTRNLRQKLPSFTSAFC